MWWLKHPWRKLSIPDWLSIYRILSVPILIILIVENQRTWLGIFLMISFLTDALDGFLARKMNVVSQRGAQLDSIGDALTYTTGMVGVIVFETDFIARYAWLIGFTFALYFFQLILAYWKYGMPSSFHTWLAKTSAFFQALFILWLFLIRLEEWLFIVAVVFSIAETVEEISLIIIKDKWESDVKGLYWVLTENKKAVEKEHEKEVV